ncbi:hypothetical protein MN608_11459 [Microdochium nivale]|nr:hypothetical protein MN608_11459 [Microdochium nivale]
MDLAGDLGGAVALPFNKEVHTGKINVIMIKGIPACLPLASLLQSLWGLRTRELKRHSVIDCRVYFDCHNWLSGNVEVCAGALLRLNSPSIPATLWPIHAQCPKVARDFAALDNPTDKTSLFKQNNKQSATSWSQFSIQFRLTTQSATAAPECGSDIHFRNVGK